MNQINLSNYKLDNRGANQLAYLMYKYKEPEFVDKVMDQFGVELLLKTKNNGLISNVILHYIKKSSTHMINNLIINHNDDFKLMKRDYLNLICYFYLSDYNRAKTIFEENILVKRTCTTESILQEKDIDFILTNNLVKLLPYLTGLFIETDNNTYHKVNPNSIKLNKINIGDDLNSYLLNKIESDLHTYSHHINKFYSQTNIKFKAIIDACNILHGRNGVITNESLTDLENIINQTKIHIGEPLVIIHCRHFKNCKLNDVFLRTNTTFYKTPYNFNDDIFIMWFFVKAYCNLYIISNDKYRDHIFKFETSTKSLIKLNQFYMCQFANIIKQQTLSYNLIQMQIQTPLYWSICIQYIDGIVYIPHISGYFVIISVG